MFKKIYCATCIGIEAVGVTVEVDLSNGVGIHIVGLPDSAVRESLLRVITAFSQYGYHIPGRRIVVNLAPADIRKEGSSFDLAIAAGMVAVSGQAELALCDDYVVMGELALDGAVRTVPGALPIACYAREAGFKGCIFPKSSAFEATDIDGLEIYGIDSLAQAVEILSGSPERHRYLVRKEDRPRLSKTHSHNDFRNVKGQKVARRGLEIAAAGSHNLLLIGSPGSGKTMMASCLPSILPPMTREEAIETSKIYSVAGHTGCGLMAERPFRSPHHSTSIVSLIGGGQSVSPGEISLAHNGVLYLDEAAQFGNSLLDALRQPLEDGQVTISRVRYKVRYPSSFMLIASMNPCPCGYYGDGTGRCNCTRTAVERYMSRISGPLMDRIDIHLNVKAISSDDLIDSGEGESSADIAARVLEARNRQLHRFRGEGIFTNSQMKPEHLARFCTLTEDQNRFLKEVIRKLNLSARAYSRILKLARTIADLEGNNFITLQNIAEAVQLRSLDRENIMD